MLSSVKMELIDPLTNSLDDMRWRFGAGKKEFSSVKMVLELCSVDVYCSLAQMRWRLAQVKRSSARLRWC